MFDFDGYSKEVWFSNMINILIPFPRFVIPSQKCCTSMVMEMPCETIRSLDNIVRKHSRYDIVQKLMLENKLLQPDVSFPRHPDWNGCSQCETGSGGRIA